MPDEYFMIHVLNNLTEEYDVILDGMENRSMLKENDQNELTIEDVRDKLSGRYGRVREQIAKHEDGPITDETGMAAYTKQSKGIFGKCVCERYGFKFQVGNNKPGATCYYCGEKGHYMRDYKVKRRA